MKVRYDEKVKVQYSSVLQNASASQLVCARTFAAQPCLTLLL